MLQGQGNVKEGSRQGQIRVKVRSRQSKHNLDLNYNLIGFDTVEINLVVLGNFLTLPYKCEPNVSSSSSMH